MCICIFFFFSSRRRHTRWTGDWSSDVCSSDLLWPPACPNAASAGVRLRDHDRSAARQLAVCHPVRPGGFSAKAIDLVLLVGLEVPLEPEPARSALPGQNVGCDPVEEPAVVAGDHGAA